jgi:hypothetical protein
LSLPIAAALIAAAALAGCKSQGPERAMARFYGEEAVTAQATTPQATTPQGTTPQGTTPQAEPEAARGSAGAAAPAAQMAARPEPATPLPEVDATPERFLGAAPAVLGAELGRPALVRAEGPARVWQYRGGTCVLDLVLYPGTDGPTVRHLEARDRVDAKPHDTAACLKTLLQRHALAATG